MNLETKIPKALWNSIRNNYGKGNFTGAILDSFYYAMELLKLKSGLEEDGVSLITKALSGDNPRIKINRLATDSEKNMQKGVEQVLRGLYQGVRNPRSHEQYNDTQEDADTIISFLSYTLNSIDKAKSKFSREDLTRRILDIHFVSSERYAELLNLDIPEKEKFEVFNDLYRAKDSWVISNLRLFFQKFFKGISQETLGDIVALVSDDLRTQTDDKSFAIVIEACGEFIWPRIEEDAKLRSESRIIKSIRSGKVETRTYRISSGSLGASSVNILDLFQSKEELISTIALKIRVASEGEFLYLNWHIMDAVFSRFDTMPEDLEAAIIYRLSQGELQVFKMIRAEMDANILKSNALRTSYNHFIEKFASEIAADDEIPF